MNFLVTGGAGFIGSHLVERLIDLNHEVIIIDDLSTGRMENLEKILASKKVHFIQESILNSEVVNELCSQSDGVFHLAAALGVKRILERPLESLITNVHGSENVIRAASVNRIKIFLASTSEVYGKNMIQPLNEKSDRVLGSPLLTRWAYSESKALDETLVQIFHDMTKLPFVIGRFFNTTGPRQTGAYGMVVPNFVSNGLTGKPIEIYGDGQQRRVFCHVHDAVEGILKVYFNEETEGHVFNIGGEEEISILDLANLVIKETKSNSEIIFVPYNLAYPIGFEDSMRRNPDTSKLRKFTGWAPKYSLKAIISDVASSMKA